MHSYQKSKVLPDLNLLFSYIKHVFPANPTHRHTLTSLVTQNAAPATRKRGIHRFTFTSLDHDLDGWVAIHWPSLLRRLFQSRDGQTWLYHQNIDAHHFEDFPTHAPIDFDDYWRSARAITVRDHLHLSLPLWSSAPPFQRLTLLAPEHERDAEHFTVFRWAARPATTSLHKLKPLHQALTKISYIHQTEVIPRLDPALTLTLKALSESSRVTDPFTTWGIAWTADGLLLHYARALYTLRKRHPESTLLPGDVHDFYIYPWSRNDALNSPSAFTRIPRFSKLLHSPSLEQTRDLLEPYRTTQGEVWDDLLLSDPRHMPEYTWLLRNNRLFETIDKLCEYSSPLEIQSRVEKAKEKRKYDIRRKNKEIVPRNRVIRTLTLDARQLGYDSESLTTITFNLTTFGNTYFITYPLELTEYIPELSDPDYFHRNHEKRDRILKDRELRVPVTHLVNTRFHKLLHRDQLFLHPSLFVPGEEALTLLEELARINEVYAKRIHPYLKPLTSFCRFVHSPEELLEGMGHFGAELETFIDPTIDCPFQLFTPRERLAFFFTKGAHLSHSPVAFETPDNLHPEHKNQPLTPYDKWCLWYASVFELPYLKYQLNQRQQSEYYAKRWLAWRRPISLLSHLPKHTYTRMPTRLPRYGHGEDIQPLLDTADQMFGESFSSY